MKKIILAAAMCVVLLSGCGYSESSITKNNTSEPDSVHTETFFEETSQSTAESEISITTTTTLPEQNADSISETEPVLSEETLETSQENGDRQTIESESVREPEKASPLDYSRENLDLFIQQAADSCNVTGISVALFDKSGIVHTYNSGYADIANAIPCSDDTVYRVASVSKLVSGISLMTLYDKGLLKPKSKLVELTGLPYNREEQTPVRLWHLLTHSAEIIDTGAYVSAVNYKYRVAGGYYTPIEDILTNSCINPVGEVFYNTNFGFGTVGAVIERVSGEYFCEYTYDNLFEPMGLNAGYAIDQISDRSKIANVYQNGKLEYEPKYSFRDCEYYRGFELGESYFTANTELLISCPDLAKIGMMISSDGSCNGVQILTPKAVDLINSVWFRTNNSFDIGLSVRIYDGTIVQGRKICGHPGQALGNVCGLYYDPNDGIGIAICTSGCNAYSAGNGVYLLLNNCIKAAYACWFDNPEQ